MKKGPEFCTSTLQRRMDLVVAGLLYPVAILGAAMLRDDRPSEMSAIETEERVGQDGFTFEIEKLRTVDPNTGVPFSDLAARMQSHGVDEVAQYRNILRGEMSGTGYRPISPLDHTAFMDGISSPKLRARHRRLVMPTRPGLISTFSLLSHANSDNIALTPDVRAESNIKDVVDASFLYNQTLIYRFLGYAAGLKKT